MKLLGNSFQGIIVEYYDSFFHPDEKVNNECKYLIEFMDKYRKHNKGDKLIDIGCGTGAYSEKMSKEFNHVFGLDLSHDMIEYAKKNHYSSNIEYMVSDIRNLNSIFDFDYSISLAHVIGYQLTDDDVDKYFLGIHRTLTAGGIFIFNFYNHSAIEQNVLMPRHIKKECNGSIITRISNATNDYDNSCLDLDYYYIISNGDRLDAAEIHEKMRYFTKTEINLFLEKNGFETLEFFNYGTNEQLTSDVWNAGCIAIRR